MWHLTLYQDKYCFRIERSRYAYFVLSKNHLMVPTIKSGKDGITMSSKIKTPELINLKAYRNFKSYYSRLL